MLWSYECKMNLYNAVFIGYNESNLVHKKKNLVNEKTKFGTQKNLICAGENQIWWKKI